MTNPIPSIPTYADIEQAAQRLEGLAHRTPVLTSAWFNHQTGSEMFFKCENFQKVGAFKFRGACNAVAALDANQGRLGVVTHSSGNHGQAVALAARLKGYPATVVMPDNAARVKISAVRDYGAEIVFCEPTTPARAAAVESLLAERGGVFIPPYDHPDVIAGQGTAARELLEDVPDLDLIIAPVGGGGLISGTAIAAKHLKPNCRVIAAEPANADDAARSFRSGKIEPVARTQTIADGLRTSLGELTFAVIQRHVDDVVTVSEQAIIKAMRQVWERMKIVIEPSCAVPLAAVLEGKVEVSGQRVGLIITGGNVDLDAIASLLAR
ncbi:MAG: pyridoxal-phosphate dependent enzyme [Wenzhouxiangella sp.]|nr:pyridoxal-phosphate dependent enzyme [Wenzhouxiangella sp.]